MPMAGEEHAMKRYFLAMAAVAAMGLAPSAAGAQAPSVEVRDAWSRATTTQARAGGVFLTMTTNGPGDRLVSAASPVAEIVELHETVAEDGVMKMKAVPELAVVPGTPAVLKPGSYHIMLIGLKQPLRQGESFPVTLRFEKAAPVTVTVTVQAGGAGGPMHRH